MGLDWLAGNKPKPGHEAELAEIIERGKSGEITDEMRDRYEAISIAAYTQVGAPVVGTDKIADAWVLAHVRESDSDEPIDLDDERSYTPATDEERQALDQMSGYHILELAEPCDGLPIYTHGSISDQLDLTSFRGKFLHDCEDIIGEALLEQAYEDQAPGELVAYGEALLSHARRYAAENGCPEIEGQHEPPDELDSPAGRAHILFAAGRWCVYWGSRGHFLDTWF